MSSIQEEINSYLGQAGLTEEEFLAHYGMPRRSGRYPYGSGKDPYQHSRDFLGRIEELKRKGWQETTENIKKEFGLTSTQYRLEKSICNGYRRAADVARAKSLKEDGLSTSEIGRRMGRNESSIRSLLNEEAEIRMNSAKQLASDLKKIVDEKKMVDVGIDAERAVGEVSSVSNVSRQKMEAALYLLEREGYHVYSGRIPQPTDKNRSTTQKVLTTPEKKHGDIFNYDEVHSLVDYTSRDGGVSLEKKFHYPTSLDRKRLYIRYPDEGGAERDGLIELRRGVPDLSLGDSRFSQVRILVDNKSYLKGMAVYNDDLPDGVDVVFNTSKPRGSDEWGKVMKKIKNDPDNPFGSAIKDADQGGQYWYDPKTGKKCSANTKGAKLGLINKRADEGDWSEWKNALPSQFLSKQPLDLAKKQLNLAKADKEAEYDEIMSLTNKTLKRHYLAKFADSCDGAAIDLKAAALPGQRYHVVIPNNTLKDNEAYVPGYKPGSKLALIRYPHAGTFEIPIVTVTDKNALGEKIIGKTPIDGICVTSKVAAQLSGADFDGDTVMCIPTHGRKGNIKIKNRKPFEKLVEFDNKLEYGATSDDVWYDSDGHEYRFRGNKKFRVMENTNREMGVISNLITDMTLGGAKDDELIRAVKHSMVVIDAEKHKLDYKQSEKDNNIAQLKNDYQRTIGPDGKIKVGGASTIVSRSKSPINVSKRQGQPKINIKGSKDYDPSKPEGALLYTLADPEKRFYVKSTYDKKTGSKTVTKADGKKITYNMYDPKDRDMYEPVMKKDPKTGKVYFTNKDGSIKYRVTERTTPSKLMTETDDAMNLVSASRHPMEILYADYANSMKGLANKARKELMTTGRTKHDPSAKKVYKKEVSELLAALNEAKKNAPKEREALRLTNAEMKSRLAKDPELKKDKESYQKMSQRLLSKYRNEVGTIARRNRTISITDRQWEAIQAGAISDSILEDIFKYSDPDVLRERAMPKNRKTLSTAQINRMKRLQDSDYTLNQIAEMMNVSPSTVSAYLKGDK